MAFTLLNELFIVACHERDLSITRRFSGNDSGRDLNAKRRDTIDRTLAKTQGKRYGYVSKIVSLNTSQRSAGAESSPPRNGPMVNPSPNAAPIRPIRVASCCGELTSPMYARATAMFPLNTPARKRAMRAMIKVLASPNIVKNTVLPTSPIMRTGLRPIRSERAPHIGENRNCAAEYEVIKRPTQIPIEAASCSPAKSSTR